MGINSLTTYLKKNLEQLIQKEIIKINIMEIQNYKHILIDMGGILHKRLIKLVESGVPCDDKISMMLKQIFDQFYNKITDEQILYFVFDPYIY